MVCTELRREKEGEREIEEESLSHHPRNLEPKSCHSIVPCTEFLIKEPPESFPRESPRSSVPGPPALAYVDANLKTRAAALFGTYTRWQRLSYADEFVHVSEIINTCGCGTLRFVMLRETFSTSFAYRACTSIASAETRREYGSIRCTRAISFYQPEMAIYHTALLLLLTKDAPLGL